MRASDGLLNPQQLCRAASTLPPHRASQLWQGAAVLQVFQEYINNMPSMIRFIETRRLVIGNLILSHYRLTMMSLFDESYLSY